MCPLHVRMCTLVGLVLVATASLYSSAHVTEKSRLQANVITRDYVWSRKYSVSSDFAYYFY